MRIIHSNQGIRVARKPCIIFFDGYLHYVWWVVDGGELVIDGILVCLICSIRTGTASPRRILARE